MRLITCLMRTSAVRLAGLLQQSSVTDPRFSRPNDSEFTGKPFEHQFALTAEPKSGIVWKVSQTGE